MGYVMKNRWNDADVEYLREHYPTTPMDELCRALNCKPWRIYSKAKQMGFKRDPEYKLQVCRKLGKELSESPESKAARFKPGQATHRLAKGVYYPGVEKTWFKPGHKVHTEMHDGAISVRKDKRGVAYKFIRIAKSVWVHLHRHIWEQAHGPVPEGYVIRFKNGDQLDVRLDNLECITLKENARRNHNYQKATTTRKLSRTGKIEPRKMTPYRAMLRITKDRDKARMIVKEHPHLAELALLNNKLKQQISNETK
jgi:hypothetical protein